jgi:predicted helicase
MTRPSKRRDPKLWQRYERSVAKIVTGLDRGAKVEHDYRTTVIYSNTLRQVDVWAEGSVVGQVIRVAIECKRYKRLIAVGEIDQFVGKLMDVDAERGILYSQSGFTSAALARAENSHHPPILPITLKSPEDSDEDDQARYSSSETAAEYSPQELTRDAYVFNELDEAIVRTYLRTGRW